MLGISIMHRNLTFPKKLDCSDDAFLRFQSDTCLHSEKSLACLCFCNGWDLRPGDQGRWPVLSASATLQHYKLAARRPHCSVQDSHPSRSKHHSDEWPWVFFFFFFHIRPVSSEESFSQVNMLLWKVHATEIWSGACERCPLCRLFHHELILLARYGKMWTFIPVLSNEYYVGGTVYQSSHALLNMSYHPVHREIKKTCLSSCEF